MCTWNQRRFDGAVPGRRSPRELRAEAKSLLEEGRLTDRADLVATAMFLPLGMIEQLEALLFYAGREGPCPLAIIAERQISELRDRLVPGREPPDGPVRARLRAKLVPPGSALAAIYTWEQRSRAGDVDVPSGPSP